MMRRLFIIFSVSFLIFPTMGQARSSLDLAIKGKGISIGDSPRFTGLRINFMDSRLEQINGVNLTIWRARERALRRAEINGIAKGIAFGGILNGAKPEEFSISIHNEAFRGLQIGLFNFTRRLKGVQIGLLNYAGNNPKFLRLLPVVNVHL